MVFSPDGTLLASQIQGEITLWEVRTRKLLATLKGHTGCILSVAFSRDGSLASGSEDVTVRLWDISPHRTSQPPTPTQPGNADFDGDGTVGFGDFLLFAAVFGQSQGDAGYDVRYDLDEDGAIGFGDFLIFAAAFGKTS